MRIPAIRGIIDRRILVNFRVDPNVLSQVCPSPFRPQVVNNFGIAGICLIRLKDIRPNYTPRFLGLSSENAAHRIAVEWDANGETKTGVYIPRRDTSSSLLAAVGGRLFSGIHHFARFDVREANDDYHVAMHSTDGAAHVSISGKTATDLPADSIFSSLATCSRFFEDGSLGYSPTTTNNKYEGLELRTKKWNVEPLTITDVESSFFNNPEIFPEDSVTFDNALLIKNIDHEWHSREAVCCH